MHPPRLREPASALTHLFAALLSVAGLAFLVRQGIMRGTAWHAVSFAIFGASLVLLYTASTLYHALPLSPRWTLVLRKLDHLMIFVLIAGSYTPFCLLPLRGPWGWSLLGAIWGCAGLGMAVKLAWPAAPRWLSVGFYVFMGWLVLVAIYPLALSVTAAVLAWLFAGGVLYTAGAVLYATKWPHLWPGRFGFHELWHLFVMGGSLAHFVAVISLI